MHPITQAIRYWLERNNEKAAAQVWRSLEVGEPNREDVTTVHQELVELEVLPAVLEALKNSV